MTFLWSHFCLEWSLTNSTVLREHMHKVTHVTPYACLRLVIFDIDSGGSPLLVHLKIVAEVDAAKVDFKDR